MADSLAADSSRPEARDANLRWTWQQVLDALHGLEFGSVTLLVQDGVVVQVERSERKRYQRAPRSSN